MAVQQQQQNTLSSLQSMFWKREKKKKKSLNIVLESKMFCDDISRVNMHQGWSLGGLCFQVVPLPGHRLCV